MKVASAALAALLAGCASVGPPSVSRDRFEYVQAISESWKSQMLLNLVKVRYADVPVFLDVTSVINAYSLEGEASISAQAAPINRGDTFLGAGATGRYSERPTISYAPLTGDKFAKSVMSPLPVSGILLLVQSGYPADIVLRICVNSINGLENARSGVAERPAEPAFRELVALLREDQEHGGVAFEARPGVGKKAMAMILRPPVDDAMSKRNRRITEILGLKPGIRELDVGYGSIPSGDTEIALLSRSMLQIMSNVASSFDVPERDVTEGRVTATRRDAADEAVLRVHESAEKQADAFVSVRYRDRWFWIDDRDGPSKRVFAFLMLMFSLTETGTAQSAPVLTVPAR
ncbi:MAG TPA: hypothetical protein VLH12_14750 [Usitatibacter sp.]|nr:hypothetical protein [Usitatibacter sp.]